MTMLNSEKHKIVITIKMINHAALSNSYALLLLSITRKYILLLVRILFYVHHKIHKKMGQF